MKTIKWSWLILLLTGLTACLSTPPAPEITPRPSATRVPTITETLTPLPTATPSPTPTPTAQPLYLFDGLRVQRAVEPSSQRGAPCGIVDFFDFPLDAPEGSAANARWSFGRYSERYSGIHAGEDWVYDTGDSLGRPVYSIGHGTVLYAQPLGWGIDQGTIIVRHVFTDGHTILSFYGHLQPDSVTLGVGTCVTRGEQIGLIGKPRGRPHLHFEIRSIFPDQPGPGYWSVDPTLAGWKPPTETIWDQRVSTSPGVQWTRPFTAANSMLVGLLISNTVAAIDNDRLLALDVDTGRVRWTRPVSSTMQDALVDETHTSIYVTTISDTLQAIDTAGRTQWQITLTPATPSTLLPMPGSGVIVHNGRSLSGYSASGNRVWQIENIPAPVDWLDGESALEDGQLLFTVGGDQPALYRLAASGQMTQVAALGGQLASSADHLFVYSPSALYQLSETPRLLKSLDRAVSHGGSLVTTLDGGLIVAHGGVNGRRLLALRPDGSLRWDRSIQQLTGGAPQLITLGAEVYAVTAEGDVWWIDQRLGEVQRVLDGTRLVNLPGATRAFATSHGSLIVDFRGGRLIAFDPRAALVNNGPDERP